VTELSPYEDGHTYNEKYTTERSPTSVDYYEAIQVLKDFGVSISREIKNEIYGANTLRRLDRTIKKYVMTFL
jgi:hypothetical protein